MRLLFKTLTLLTIALTSLIAVASTVEQVTFTQLVTSSEFIFKGRVIDTHAEADSRGAIHTFVTFEIQDVLKGQFPSSQIVLSFLGGTIGTQTYAVSDLVLPAPGETGIYFVESLTRRQVHPLYGWDQGHFLVRTGADQRERVFSRSGRPIVGFDQSTTITPRALSNGIARGVVAAEQSRRDEAVPVSDFKERIAAVLRGR